MNNAGCSAGATSAQCRKRRLAVVNRAALAPSSHSVEYINSRIIIGRYGMFSSSDAELRRRESCRQQRNVTGDRKIIALLLRAMPLPLDRGSLDPYRRALSAKMTVLEPRSGGDTTAG